MKRQTILNFKLICIFTCLMIAGSFVSCSLFGTNSSTSSVPGQSVALLSSIYGADQPVGIALNTDGTRLYVCEQAGDRHVRVFDPATGKQLPALAPPPGDAAPQPTYVAVSPQGNVYVNDLSSQKGLLVYSANGNFQGWVDPMADQNQTWSPLALTFDKTGNLYVTDITADKHRVLVFDAQNQLKLQFGSEGSDPGQFSFPNGIAVSSSGDIWVSDSNNARIEVFDATGKLKTVVKQAGGQTFAMPRGILITPAGNVAVVDTMEGTVTVIDPADDTKSYTLGGYGTDDGQFRYPQGLALDGKGRLYVADRDNNRIEVFGTVK